MCYATVAGNMINILDTKYFSIILILAVVAIAAMLMPGIKMVSV